jgi:hypothetical protein
VALSIASRRPVVNRHPALRSPDFPLHKRIVQRLPAVFSGLVAPSGCPAGLKESARGESPTAPLVMEMARAVIGQKGDDTSIITPNLDSVSVRLVAVSRGLHESHTPDGSRP